MTKKEEKLLIEIESVREWIVESKEDFIGETRTNALFIIERLTKVLRDNEYEQ